MVDKAKLSNKILQSGYKKKDVVDMIKTYKTLLEKCSKRG